MENTLSVYKKTDATEFPFHGKDRIVCEERNQ